MFDYMNNAVAKETAKLMTGYQKWLYMGTVYGLFTGILPQQ